MGIDALPLRTQSDRRLVRLVREGYESAFEEIVRRYRRPLDRFAASLVGARSEDVTQDSFRKALVALRRDEGEVELRPWLYRIVRNTALNDLRDRPPAAAELTEELLAGGRSAAAEAEQRAEVAALTARLRALPDNQRAALVMRELEGMSHAEIAAALGISGGAARQAIARGRAAVRAGLGALLPLPLLRSLAGAGEIGTQAALGAGATASGTAALKVGLTTVAVVGSIGAGVALEHRGGGHGGGPVDHPRPVATAAGRDATGRTDAARVPAVVDVVERSDAARGPAGAVDDGGRGDARRGPDRPDGARTRPDGEGSGDDGSGHGGSDPHASGEDSEPSGSDRGGSRHDGSGDDAGGDGGSDRDRSGDGGSGRGGSGDGGSGGEEGGRHGSGRGGIGDGGSDDRGSGDGGSAGDESRLARSSGGGSRHGGSDDTALAPGGSPGGRSGGGDSGGSSLSSGSGGESASGSSGSADGGHGSEHGVEAVVEPPPVEALSAEPPSSGGPGSGSEVEIAP
ncbi:MAG TPA: sigma-70 family RNA polymerase sigma factor [Solirubrobacterales bacterium]|nr:sigma-70 family RNA polymerase sigma factor [Solirubrobacterales bacterium]